MSEFKTISPNELTKNPFEMIGTEWMLITAEKEGKCNTMTASWGGVGILWGKSVAYIFIRPQRYTKEFIDNSTSLSLSILDESYKKTLSYLGRVSGRDEDKIAKSELTTVYEDDTPYFAEANTAFICRKLFASELSPDSFVDKSLIAAHYPEKDFHTLYVVEIEKILVK